MPGVPVASENVPQIPWAKEVKVTDIHGTNSLQSLNKIIGVDLELPDIKASIDRYGDVELTIDSRENIGYYMGKSPELTRQLRKYNKAKGVGFFLENAQDWLAGEDIEEQVFPWGSGPPGVIDWWPGIEKVKWPKIGKRVLVGSTSDSSEYWIGTDFPFVHFELPDGDEGLVIDWAGKKDKPEVWLGDVSEFFANNEESFDSWEAYASYNNRFENGFLWALDLMDVFLHKDIPEWVVRTIDNDPDLLWPEVVEKLMPRVRLRALPELLEKAVLTWIDRRRAEAERAAGQMYIWPPPEK